MRAILAELGELLIDWCVGGLCTTLQFERSENDNVLIRIDGCWGYGIMVIDK